MLNGPRWKARARSKGRYTAAIQATAYFKKPMKRLCFSRGDDISRNGGGGGGNGGGGGMSRGVGNTRPRHWLIDAHYRWSRMVNYPGGGGLGGGGGGGDSDGGEGSRRGLDAGSGDGGGLGGEGGGGFDSDGGEDCRMGLDAGSGDGGGLGGGGGGGHSDDGEDSRMEIEGVAVAVAIETAAKTV